ncbi:MAG TPA: hypothetical protein VEV83_01980, partial [Parafilimonas sp.]|nr:hypothetical protein [Parafilimonas sp.]
MKTKIYTAITLLMPFAYCNTSGAQSANTSLSNLVSPTAVNIDLLPNKDNKRDLGSSGKSWKDIHLDGS